MRKPQENPGAAAHRGIVPSRYLSATDLVKRAFLEEAGLPASAGTSAEHRSLLDELEAGLAARQPRGHGHISASTTVVYVGGEWFSFYGGSDDALRRRDLHRQQLIARWVDVRGRIWEAMIDGTLPTEIVSEDGHRETLRPSTLKLNVEAEVFNQSRVVWPRTGLLVVTETAFKRWMRSASKRGATNSPSDRPGACNSSTATNDAAASTAQQPINRAKRRPRPKPAEGTPAWLSESSSGNAFEVRKNAPGGGGKVTERVVAEMTRQVKGREITLTEFTRLSEPKLAKRFGASRTVVIPAREKVLAALREEAASAAGAAPEKQKKAE
jgi:hypothetical protein